MRDALAAEGAVRLPHRTLMGDCDRRMRAGADHIPDIQRLDLIADRHAAIAADALTLVADDRDTLIPVILRILVLIIHDIVYSQRRDGILQLAGSVPLTGGTVNPVLGEQQFQIRTACFTDT